MKNKIVAGQTVFVKRLDARGSNLEPSEAKVTKVGNKYFEVDGFRTRFCNDKLLNDGKGYSPNLKVYISKQDILNEIEFDSLVKSIKGVFSTYSKPNLSLDQLREINAIINKPVYEEQDIKN